MQKMLLGTLSIILLASPVLARDDRAIGRETVIGFASGGGLRDWQAGPPNSGIVYVRDRTLRWYRVQLTGPCIKDRALDTLTYTTDPNGTFDRFSRVSLRRFPNQICGVRSIKTSLPPKGQPGAPRPRR
ncbi:hypothetical protein NF700_15745 [Sphingomonadaceae bacterium OTU29MARTA1]|uniref:hypothetical protein n=1 Tax=Sphingomonas sp. Leaf37 TaxID=2876552 RepID=UPI001E4E1390|nr:hypothetical protein [Sphingomonas sp. Leaf37]USU08496.1 hypothetical protein NF700_15745 [Sphingomonadaceae bacterium OTU29MARTA1]USU11974.1 hypothetical protein NF701_15815 [Sphingomonadaceae bacterium OTU29THOMA1]